MPDHGVSEGTLAEAERLGADAIGVALAKPLHPVYREAAARAAILAALPVLLGELVPREEPSSLAECRRKLEIVLDEMGCDIHRFRERAERAEAALAECRETLEPFAGCRIMDDGTVPPMDEDWPPMTERIVDWFGWSDFQRARKALSDIPGGGG